MLFVHIESNSKFQMALYKYYKPKGEVHGIGSKPIDKKHCIKENEKKRGPYNKYSVMEKDMLVVRRALQQQKDHRYF